MKRLACLIFAAAMMLAMNLTAFAENTPVKIDFSETRQEIDGFGASYTWYLGWAVNHNQAETIWDWVFNETEFNILRFRDLNEIRNEGEAEMPKQGYPEYYAVYEAAKNRGIDPTVLVTSWGEYRRDLPFVAYTEKSANGFSYYTLAKNAAGEYMYDELAEFCVQSVKYFFDAGIPVDYFSIANEIELQERHTDEKGNARDEAGFFFGYDETEDHCCYWKAYKAVYEAFAEAFGEFAPKILGAETMAGYQDLLKRYLDPVEENCPGTLEVVGHHLYGTDLSEGNLRKISDEYSGKYKLWQTEWYNNDYFGHAEQVIDELIYENVSAYLYWNGVWDFDTGNCIIQVGYDPDSEITRLGNHYIMEHFSKYIKQGYRRVEVEESLNSKVGAFISPDQSKLTVVVMNPTEEYDDLTLDLGGRKVLGSMSVRSVEGENRFYNRYLEDSGEYEDGFEIEPRSLYTLVFDLEPDENYAAPAPKPENPFVRKKTSERPFIIGGIAVGAVVVMLVGVGVAVGVRRKGKG